MKIKCCERLERKFKEMADIMRVYKENNINVPIRVDHVPLMAGESQELAGYTSAGRLYAIGYLKGILESVLV